MSLLLEGKRAFVSGGTRGIGAAICDVFAREGADVAFNYHTRDDLAAEVIAKIESYGRRAFGFKVSVTDRVELKKIAREIAQDWAESIFWSTTLRSINPTILRRRPIIRGIGL